MIPSRARTLIHSILCLFALALAQTSAAQQSRVELTGEMVDVANEFLDSLNNLQKSRGVFEFDDEERFNFHFIPRPRKGVVLKGMDSDQLQIARRLLQTFFSNKGFAKSEEIRGLETVLAQIEFNGRFVRDPELYYISIFGTPGLDNNWALRYEGHHQAFNWTFVRGLGVASTPQFFGSNPAEVRTDPQRGKRVLGTEEDLGRELVTSLDEAQAPRAILEDDVPNDIITSARKEVLPLAESGITYADLTSQQKQLLLSLIEELASTQPASIAQQRMDTIRSDGLDDIRFTWIGGLERGDRHYYRVQGKGFLIEYDNTQNNANHVHLVWRDFNGDFGRDLLKLHYDSVAMEYGPGHQH